jgi:WS/DGAT/MGAT family acyltransferase
LEQLSSIDASFIQAQSENLPMHISTLSIYDPSTAPQGKVRFKDIMQLFEDAIYQVPLLRRRLVEVPGNMDFPYWIEDPDLDVEFHVRHVALPKPGDWRQFYIQVARIHARPLDMSRPLWEVYVIEGLDKLEGIPSGSFAVMQKLHHAAMDGAAVKKMIMALHELEPTAAGGRTRREQPLIREERPWVPNLLMKSYRRSMGRPLKFGRAFLKTIEGSRKVKQAEEAGVIGEPIETPASRFNGKTSCYRVVTTATFPFSDFRQLRYALSGATINDLAISIFGGALRRYLLAKGESVDQALVAQIPVDIRSDSQQEEDGNRITTINASCGSDIESPLERLDAVRLSTEDGKKRLEVMGPSLTRDMAEALGPHVTKGIFALMGNASSLGPLGNFMPTGPNFILSNMPGPPVSLYLCGAELKWGTGLGPMMPNMGMFVTVTSMQGQFTYGISACRDMLPDPDFFQQCIQDSFEETKKVLQPLAQKNHPVKTGGGAGSPAKRKSAASSAAT